MFKMIQDKVYFFIVTTKSILKCKEGNVQNMVEKNLRMIKVRGHPQIHLV